MSARRPASVFMAEDEYLYEITQEIVEMRRRLDRLEYLLMQYARAQGATWEELGEMLGISRQAAQSRWRRVRRRQR